MYSSTFSLTSALDEMGGQHHAPAVLRPGKTRYPLYYIYVIYIHKFDNYKSQYYDVKY